MHLLMMTYHQDIMTNFSCVCDRYTVYPFFMAVYQNMHKHTCPCQPFKVFMLKINNISLQNRSKAILNKLSVILIMHN